MSTSGTGKTCCELAVAEQLCWLLHTDRSQRLLLLSPTTLNLLSLRLCPLWLYQQHCLLGPSTPESCWSSSQRTMTNFLSNLPSEQMMLRWRYDTTHSTNHEIFLHRQYPHRVTTEHRRASPSWRHLSDGYQWSKQQVEIETRLVT